MVTRVHISEKVSAAALFAVLIFAFALWKSPLLQPVTTVTKETSATQEKKTTSPPKIARNSLSLPTTTTSSSTPQTETRALADAIVGSYVQSKQSGRYNPTALQTTLSKTIDAQFASHTTAATVYTASRITTIPKTTTAVAAYKKGLTAALTPLTAITEYELTTFSKALNGQDSSTITILRKDADIYESIIATLIAMNVPQGAVGGHLAMINAYARFAQTLRDLSSATHDPVRALVLTRDFLENADAIQNSYTQLSIYFTLNTPTS